MSTLHLISIFSYSEISLSNKELTGIPSILRNNPLSLLKLKKTNQIRLNDMIRCKEKNILYLIYLIYFLMNIFPLQERSILCMFNPFMNCVVENSRLLNISLCTYLTYFQAFASQISIYLTVVN